MMIVSGGTDMAAGLLTWYNLRTYSEGSDPVEHNGGTQERYERGKALGHSRFVAEKEFC